MENILPQDTLETGFRVKVNEAIDEIINDNPTINQDGDAIFPKHGGTEWVLDLSSHYYKKDEVVGILNPALTYATETTSGQVKKSFLK